MPAVHIDSSGTGPPLVLIHSLLTDARAYDATVIELGDRYCVHRVWLPGFGPSAPLDGSEPHTLFDLAGMVADAMSDGGVSPGAAVLGNGLGAFVAVAMAIAHGSDFGPLIVANGGAVFSEDRRGAFETMSRLVSEAGMAAVVDTAVRRIFPEEYLAAHPETIEDRRRVLLDIDPISFAACCRALHAMDLRPDLGRITNPTLVIGGSADATTPPEMSAELAASIAGAELVILDDCGHCPPLQQPEALSAAVDAFLSRHLQR
ncbi:MAG: alpha/beta fold hydrolase [Acidimicrobiaceae bacterium]|nr:alpha/beta fold hydrolase [Acidimicrobiaceae bacterium]MXZ66895.1 alpha/beta fold hydrolase [Acidimicrobiaceae bacterium]MYA14342.1 alpha/beta fold hydrolase [Acidimicrobiaceae bacterium]MYF32994.1 alpha/beta fold hydrolase [Acidimicrobiaceae bacterium]MYG78934.1 alpha/beta fold hydrolase [Acidimicrobiaceae bacterium]